MLDIGVFVNFASDNKDVNKFYWRDYWSRDLQNLTDEIVFFSKTFQ